MAKRRKSVRKIQRQVTRREKVTPPPSLIQAAERAILDQSNKALNAATSRYDRLMRQARAATNDATKRKYLTAALSAVVIAGLVANELKRQINKRPARRSAKKRQ